VTSAPPPWHKAGVFAAWFHNLDPHVFKIGGYGPLWYGLSYVLSGLIGYWLYKRLATRGYTDLPPERVGDFILYIGMFGVLLGGRIGWILFYGMFQQQPPGDHFWWLKVWKGGMSSHGGILGIVFVTYYLSRRWKISWTSLGDTLCVVAPVGLMLVRCANFVNGELYGHETHSALAVKFPQEIESVRNLGVAEKVYNAVQPLQDVLAKYGPEREDWAPRVIEASRHEPAVQAAIEPLLTPRHPSQLYEAALEGVMLFVILWLIRTRFRMPRGAITGLFFILYAIARIVGEIFRVPDEAWHMGPFSAGQFLSLFMFGIGAAFLVWSSRTREYERADSAEGTVALGKKGA
jgi:phosphatidylglycerol:prolipoprotein diacylglycerol transferase